MTSKRRALCTPETILNAFSFKGVENLVDFGCGLGFYIPEFRKLYPKLNIWPCDCQQDLLDRILRRKLLESWENVTPVYIDRSDHPLLPSWIPLPDAVFASLSLSTFPNPGLAMDGLFRSMRRGGKLVLVEWSKVETSFGPKVNEKTSIEKMENLAKEYELTIVKSVRFGELFYGMELKANNQFTYGFYDLKESDDYERNE